MQVLREEGYRTSSSTVNPATIIDDPDLADRTYIEPITPYFVKKIIEREHPDAPADMGDDRLNTAWPWRESGVLQKYGVELIGASWRQYGSGTGVFKAAMDAAGLRLPRRIRPLAGGRKELLKRWISDHHRPRFTLGGRRRIARTAEEFDDAWRR